LSPNPPTRLSVAVVHDWLVTWRGGENVLAQVVDLLPSADLYALVDFLPPATRALLHGKRARTSFLQRVPLARRHFRMLLPLFPRAVESLDVAGHDIVVSISHAVAKNVRVAEHQRHVCYCLTPMRYAWDLRDQYLSSVGASSGPRRRIADRLLDRLQSWDREASDRVHAFIAISHYVADRIKRAYGRDAEVVYPPVDVDYFQPPADEGSGDYYLTASRWVPYKRIDAIVAAFGALPDRRLIVAGDGPDAARIRRAAGGNVQFVGEVDRSRLRALMQGARAFLFAAEEDFGIVPLEAQACGIPVIALGRGGALETIRTDTESPTGLFFHEQDPGEIAGAVRAFEEARPSFSADACRRNALRFSAARFRAQFLERLMPIAMPAHEAG
jgi:glycosyltransferase involved in cell wall biosynthesis